MNETINLNSLIETEYNSGTYIGRVIEDRKNFWLVEVLAVKVHPTQGDLHNPNQVEGVAFHERKALAFKEKFNARKRKTSLYTGEVPEYSSSLKDAVKNLRQSLSEETLFNKKSLEKLDDLEESFYHEIY